MLCWYLLVLFIEMQWTSINAVWWTHVGTSGVDRCGDSSRAARCTGIFILELLMTTEILLQLFMFSS